MLREPIRRGLQVVVQEIRDNRFDNAYRGSSLETVVHSIAEHRDNQIAFGRFLDTCLCCQGETELVQAVRELDAQNIKGLGPACANLLYFCIRPSFRHLIPPSSRAITS